MVQSSLFVTFGSALSLFAGFLSQVIVAWYFGTNEQVDAFMAAFVVPSYLQALLLTGIPFVLVPMFVSECEDGRESDAWALVGTLLRVFTVCTIICAVLCFSWSTQIISISAPGLSDETSQLAGRMLAVLMLGLPFSALGTLSVGIQNARGKFFLPALAPALGTICNVVIIVLGNGPFGGMSLAWGGLAFIVVQCVITLLPVLRKCWNLVAPLHDERLLRMLRLLSPIVFFGLIGRASPVFERYFASGLPQGAIAYLGYGDRIAAIVQALLGTGIAAAIFPDMARSFAAEGKPGLIREYLKAMRFTWGTTLPVVAIASIVALPLVQLLFLRGNFTYDSAVKIAYVLPVFMGVVLCNVLGSIIGRALYVQGKTFGFNFIGALVVGLYPLFAILLVPQMGYVGLAVSGLVVNAVGVLGGYLLLWQTLGVAESPHLFKYVLGSILAAITVFGVAPLFPWSDVPLVNLSVSGVLGFSVYIMCLTKLDPELKNEVAVRLKVLWCDWRGDGS